METFDIAVIGSGPGGYVAAIKAAQEGASVALIESGTLGGTCLNRGCIPTKNLLANSDVLRKIREAKHFGITLKESSLSVDYGAMIERKDSVVSDIRSGLKNLIESNQVKIFSGKGSFLSRHEIQIKGKSTTTIQAEKVILAMGSEPRDIAAFPCDGKLIHNSTTILDCNKLPKSIAIIGAGYIGCEFASLFHELGVEVHLLEACDRIIPMEAEAIAQPLHQTFAERGIHIHTGVLVSGIDKKRSSVVVNLKEGSSIKAEMALISIGRQLNTEGIGLEKIALDTDKQGAIAVNKHMETVIPGVYAIGDITAKWMLAHVASHQGLIAAAHATGKHDAVMHYNAVPSVIFTHPEAASVGLTLEKALEQGHKAKLGAFPFQALGKAQAVGETGGFAQLVVEERTGEILGAQVIGPDAANLIAQVTQAMHNELTVECISDTIHAHPTISEAWMEAALLAQGTPLHLPPNKQQKR